MEEQEESSTEFQPLVITEEKGNIDGNIVEQSTGNQIPNGQSTLSTPYIQEMDVLLKSCENLTGIPFRSRHIEVYSDASLSKSSYSRGKEEVKTQKYGKDRSPPEASCSSFYIDTHLDVTEKKIEWAEGHNSSTVIHRPGISHHLEMPLSSAGNNLRASMLDYEGHLLGMLAMLESCMEEAGMDFEPQNQAVDAGQEYVHINKNPYCHMGTTQMKDQPESPAQLQMSTNSSNKGDNTSEDSGIGDTIDQRVKECTHNDLVGSSKEIQETQGNLLVGQEPDFMSSDLQGPLDQANQDPIFWERIKTGHIFNEKTNTVKDIAGARIDDTISGKRHDLKSDFESEINKLRSQMENCIEEVQRLQKSRKDLLLEVLQLRGSKTKEDKERRDEDEAEVSIDTKAGNLIIILKTEEEERRQERSREIQGLREERADEERKTWKVNLERQGLQEELRRLRKKLFAVARDCAQSQATLSNTRCDVELLRTEEEKLNSLVLQLTEERCQLRSALKNQLLELEAELQHQSSEQTSNAQEELTECRRNSCGDVQQYVQGELKALEDRYAPILEALLKRKEATAGALVKAKDQCQELRVQVKPLVEEIQKLELERICLEERLKLTRVQRKEETGRFKEAVEYLEESIRELKTEMEIQKRKNKDLEELKERLNKQLLLYRITTEEHNNCDQQEKK